MGVAGDNIINDAMDDNHQSLIHRKPERSKAGYWRKPLRNTEKRRCLKCGVVFLSAGHHNRCCGSCAAQNSKAAFRAESGRFMDMRN